MNPQENYYIEAKLNFATQSHLSLEIKDCETFEIIIQDKIEIFRRTISFPNQPFVRKSQKSVIKTGTCYFIANV